MMVVVVVFRLAISVFMDVLWGELREGVWWSEGDKGGHHYLPYCRRSL